MSRSTSIFGRPTISNKVSLFRQKYQPIIPKIVQISSYTDTETPITIDSYSYTDPLYKTDSYTYTDPLYKTDSYTYTDPLYKTDSYTYTEKINKNDASTEAYNENDISIPINLMSSLNTINTNYISNLASKKYESIPTEFNNYLQLYNIVNTFANETTNNNFKTFLDITLGSLKGAVETYSLYSRNIDLTNNNNILTNRIEEITRGVNKQKTISNVTGQLSMQKTFTIAPLFSHYISTYGMPEYGEGFDPEKLSNILTILNENGIDPYKIQ